MIRWRRFEYRIVCGSSIGLGSSRERRRCIGTKVGVWSVGLLLLSRIFLPSWSLCCAPLFEQQVDEEYVFCSLQGWVFDILWLLVVGCRCRRSDDEWAHHLVMPTSKMRIPSTLRSLCHIGVGPTIGISTNCIMQFAASLHILSGWCADRRYSDLLEADRRHQKEI